MTVLNLIVFMFSFVVFTVSAYAQEPKITIVERIVERDSSAFHRMNKAFTVQAQIAGAGPVDTSSRGIIAGYHLAQDKVVQVEITGGDMAYPGYFSSNTVRSQTAGVFYKQFSGNSFYFKTGLDYTSLERRYTYSFLGAPEGYAYKGNKVSASFSIGNQWQWENFTLGCDWIGWSLPLTSSTSAEETWGNDDIYTQRQLKTSQEDYLKNGYPLALHLYMGASF